MQFRNTRSKSLPPTGQNRYPSKTVPQPLRQISGHSWQPVVKAVVLWCCVVAILGLGLSAAVLAGDRSSDREQSGEPRPIGDIRKDVKAFVKRSKLKEDPVASVGAIVDLCHLHIEIVNDRRFEKNDQLKSFRAIAATRLKNYAKELELEIKRSNRRSANESRQARKLMRDPARAADGNSIPAGDQPEGNDPSVGGDEALFRAAQPGIDHGKILADSMAHGVYTMSTISGGPVQVWSHVGGNFAPPWDHGPELVALIESTIDPQSWKRNGGEGVIHYYRPLRILVVAASSSVQDDVNNTLRNLRRLSR